MIIVIEPMLIIFAANLNNYQSNRAEDQEGRIRNNRSSQSRRKVAQYEVKNAYLRAEGVGCLIYFFLQGFSSIHNFLTKHYCPERRQKSRKSHPNIPPETPHFDLEIK